MDLTKNKLIYVGDPMCSWCYGITDELTKLKEKYKGTYELEAVMGGLRPNTEHPMDARTKKTVKHHWEEVNKRSGKPFKYDLLNNDEPFIYDTEKPCRAVVVVRKLKPKATMPFFEDIQTAFYAENSDTNDVETYIPLAEKYSVSREDFIRLYNDEEVRKETYEDFVWAKQVGVTGFPSVLFLFNQQLYALALGYSTFDRMDEIVEKVIEEAKQQA